MAWSDVVRKDAPEPSLPRARLPSLSSRGGISVAVVDANALIASSSKLLGVADRFFTVAEVLHEVRDPSSRMQLEALPFTVECMEPTEEALAKVVQFARDTGDLQSLSDVDLKLLALSFTLEEQAYGSAHLRPRPPPFHVTRGKGVREQALPGWGSNVPNLEEWEGISEVPDDAPEQESHILGLKNLNLDASELNTCSVEDEQSLVDTVADSAICRGGNCVVEGHSGHEETYSKLSSPRRPRGNEIASSGEGKLEVPVGVDAAKGDDDDITNGGDWERAISRSARRKYDKRAARAAMTDRSAAALELKTSHYKVGETLEDDENSEHCQQYQIFTEESMAAHCEDDQEIENCQCSLSDEEESISVKLNHEVTFADVPSGKLLKDENEANERCIPITESSMREDEPVSQDCAVSEDSGMLQPLSSSNVACITADFAMQNVLLQIGLRVMSPNGLQVQQLHRWVLKCEACRNITSDVGRIFCSKCGNGGTLFKVSVTIGPNGLVHKESRRRTNIRGTKYSLPMPKGGRNGVIVNPILREDQLPHKLLYPKKKKVLRSGQDAFTHSEIFMENTGRKGQLRPPVREALAIFSGRQNPNDCRLRKKH